MQSEPNTAQTPFQINVADRVKRLPPYLFGKINDLKYRKRRAGADIIDLGMGNPSDIPDPLVDNGIGEPLPAPPIVRKDSWSWGTVGIRRGAVTPDRWTTGEKDIARDREWILGALPASRGLACE